MDSEQQAADLTECYVTTVPQGVVFSETSDIERFIVEIDMTGDKNQSNQYTDQAREKLVEQGKVDVDVFESKRRIDTVWPVHRTPLPHSAKLPERARV